jgi:hypothetical protein
VPGDLIAINQRRDEIERALSGVDPQASSCAKRLV